MTLIMLNTNIRVALTMYLRMSQICRSLPSFDLARSSRQGAYGLITNYFNRKE